MHRMDPFTCAHLEKVDALASMPLLGSCPRGGRLNVLASHSIEHWVLARMPCLHRRLTTYSVYGAYTCAGYVNVGHECHRKVVRHIMCLHHWRGP